MERSQVQYIDRIVDVQAVMQRQVPTISSTEDRGGFSENLDRVVDVPGVMERRRSMIQKVARTAEIPIDAVH